MFLYTALHNGQTLKMSGCQCDIPSPHIRILTELAVGIITKSSFLCHISNKCSNHKIFCTHIILYFKAFINYTQ